MPIRGVALRTCRKQWTIGRGGERRSGISVLMVRHDDHIDKLRKKHIKRQRSVLIYENEHNCVKFYNKLLPLKLIKVHARTHRHRHRHTYIYIYIYVCVCVCVCVCVYVYIYIYIMPVVVGNLRAPFKYWTKVFASHFNTNTIGKGMNTSLASPGMSK